MLQTSQDSAENAIIALLPDSEHRVIEPFYEWVDLHVGQFLHSANRTVDFAYFPTKGVCSLLAQDAKGERSETGIVGREGFLGTAIVLFAGSSPTDVVVESKGRALRIGRKDLQDVIPTCPGLLSLLLHTHVLGVQSEQSAVSNSHYTISQRVARRILMTHDRIHSNEFVVTHDYLSEMLAVRRSGVTEALGKLVADGIISSIRGKITVRKRSALKKIAGGSYGVPEREYVRLMKRPNPKLLPR